MTSQRDRFRQRNAHLDDFAKELPKLTETDLATLGHSGMYRLSLRICIL